MQPFLSRRDLLVSGMGLGLATSLTAVRPRPARAAAPLSLEIARRTISVNGRAAAVFGILQPDGTPGLVLNPGERFQLALHNRAGEDTIVHWHGQTPPPDQDGVTETGYVAVLPRDAQRAYDYAPRPGTHWMHSHHGLQEQLLMAAPLIVRSADDARMDAQDVTILLHDFTFRDPAELLASISGSMPKGGKAMDSGTLPGMTMTPSGPGTRLTSAPPDLNDVDYDAYLANDRTLADPAVIRTERSGRIRLRLINGATSTAFWVDLGGHAGTAIAVDGNPVRPVGGRTFPLAQGQRLDVLLHVPASGTVPVLAQREGSRERTGIILAAPGATIGKIGQAADRAVAAVDLSLERRLAASVPLSQRAADVTHRIALTGTMMPYAWSIDDRTWANHKPSPVRKGQRVVLDMVNRSQMAHPMHLHGHHFQVVGLNGTALAGAMRDTVLVPANGSVRVAFDANNPGRWLLHCHNLFHMATGMMTEIAYADAA